MRNAAGAKFVSRVRDELARVPLERRCCILAEIEAMVYTYGHLRLSGSGGVGLFFRIKQIVAARRLLTLLRYGIKASPVLHFTSSGQTEGHKTSVITLNPSDTSALLSAMLMIETDAEGNAHISHMKPRYPITRQCCSRAFLRGAFLGCGSMSEPSREYHIEWKAKDREFAALLEKQLSRAGLKPHTYDRSGVRVVYMKSADSLSDALALMGAGQSVIIIGNMRVHKQVRSAAARAANCDERNSERAVETALTHIETLNKLVRTPAFKDLNPVLREAAELRMSHPELSIKELGELASPPVGKSGMNHRLRRLMTIALAAASKEERE